MSGQEKGRRRGTEESVRGAEKKKKEIKRVMER